MSLFLLAAATWFGIPHPTLCMTLLIVCPRKHTSTNMNHSFMVGFREWSSAKPMPWSEVVFSWFGLVKIPGNFTWSTWDGDTSSWEF